ncbi:hypothetical protein ASG65_27785 [Bacillus sp. Leaf13]|nr:hypothetical protein ASG65_27785 [Bacillus sp. Leaf13]
MKNILSVLGVMVISLIGVFSFGTDKASADYSSGWGSFHTEDGVHEGIVSTNNTDREIVIFTRDMWRQSYPPGTRYPAYAHNIKARVCNVSTNACTGYKAFTPHYNSQGAVVTFSGMKVGTFKIDISDDIYGKYVYGQRNIYVQ